jgi:hypothetical protein
MRFNVFNLLLQWIGFIFMLANDYASEAAGATGSHSNMHDPSTVSETFRKI